MRFYVSIGDINGIGIEIALRAQPRLAPLQISYGIDQTLLVQAQNALDLATALDVCTIAALDLRKEFAQTFPHSRAQKSLEHVLAPIALPTLCAGQISAQSGLYSCKSFVYGILLAQKGVVDALVSLPIHKKAWNLAGIPYAGHTELLRAVYDTEIIMALGCKAMMVALFTDHIPLAEVSARVNEQAVFEFLLRFAQTRLCAHKVAVLGLNPHAGDGGCIGTEDAMITAAVARANAKLKREVFVGAVVPDSAFIPAMRERFQTFVAMYHDQALAPLKALFFDQSVQASLGLPIVRVSVDHGTAFELAYQHQNPSILSFTNAFEMAANLANKEDCDEQTPKPR